MQVIRIKNNMMIEDNLQLMAGKRYVVADSIARMMTMYYGEDSLTESHDFRKFYNKFDHRKEKLNDKTLLIWRTGGIGDILFTTPAIKYLKTNYPNSKIIFACRPFYKDIIAGNPYIDEITDLPLDFDYVEKSDFQLIFEGIIEENKAAEKVNAYDLFLENFGLLDEFKSDDKIPDIYYSEIAGIYADAFLKSHDLHTEDKILIGINYKTSTIIRDYPFIHWLQLMELLHGIFPNIHFVMLGGKKDGEALNKTITMPEYVVDFSSVSRTLEDSVAMVDKIDLFMGADSGLLHVAGGCSKPIVGFYGPFASSLRARYYPHVLAFDADLSCSPCFLHSPVPCKNSLKDGSSACMYLLTPTKVVQYIKTMLEEYFGDRLERR